MKSSGLVRFQEGLFSKDICEAIIEYVRELPDNYWYHRLKINSLPTKGSKICDYYFLGDGQQPKEFREFLNTLAPLVDGVKPKELIINKYEPGGYMPEHVDISLVLANMVIQLSDEGDGIEIEGKFIQDVPGNATIFPSASPPHEVPPVKKQRFVLIYLYE